MLPRHPRSTLFPYTTLFRSTGTLLWQLPFTDDFDQNAFTPIVFQDLLINAGIDQPLTAIRPKLVNGRWIADTAWTKDRKSTRLNSSHTVISYAVFCLKKKK